MMSIKVIFVSIFAFIYLSVAQSELQDPDIQNVVTVPPNCPPGQQWINGACRDIWRMIIDENAASLGAIVLPSSNRNVVTVPANCPPGQELINGVCRDVWRLFRPTTPLPRNAENLNWELRDKRQSDEGVYVVDALEASEGLSVDRNIINIPNQCPIGYKPDALGNCRPILI